MHDERNDDAAEASLMTTVLPAAGPQQLSFTAPSYAVSLRQAAVVVNPSKFSARHLKRFIGEVDRAFESVGWLAPIWLHTTATTRGTDEVRVALEAGVDVVFVAGGDGTIRAVAEQLAGTDTAIALLPVGTGNLLARNLGIPRKDITAAVRTACTGIDRAIDVGWIETSADRDGGSTERFAFLVMAGAGFDAATMAGADHTMKTRLGPFAYLVSGALAIQRRMASTTISVDGRTRKARASRGVIVGNCGSLTMGLTLMPDADPSDGILDGVVLFQRTIAEWAFVAWSLLAGHRRAGHLMPSVRGRVIEIRTDLPQPVEVDGDVVGEARRVRFEVQPGALLVRCPSGQPSADS